MVEDSLVYDETLLLRTNDDGSERWTRRTKENVLATSQLERTVTYDMRGRVRATREAAPGPSGA